MRSSLRLLLNSIISHSGRVHSFGPKSDAMCVNLRSMSEGQSRNEEKQTPEERESKTHHGPQSRNEVAAEDGDRISHLVRLVEKNHSYFSGVPQANLWEQVSIHTVEPFHSFKHSSDPAEVGAVSLFICVTSAAPEWGGR